MTSNLYVAKRFYQLQQKKEIGVIENKKGRLYKDNKGFYLYKHKTNGSIYKQRLKDNSLIYSRSEGITLYQKKNDRKKLSMTTDKSSIKNHNKHPYLNDRMTKKGKELKY